MSTPNQKRTYQLIIDLVILEAQQDLLARLQASQSPGSRDWTLIEGLLDLLAELSRPTTEGRAG